MDFIERFLKKLGYFALGVAYIAALLPLVIIVPVLERKGWPLDPLAIFTYGMIVLFLMSFVPEIYYYTKSKRKWLVAAIFTVLRAVMPLVWLFGFGVLVLILSPAAI